jgi:predicted flap endonuclease-1-like 5' DNA nuclease
MAARMVEMRLQDLTGRLAAINEDMAALQSRADAIRAEIEHLRARPEDSGGLVMPQSSEQLTLIRGIDEAAATLLNAAGITAFADIAALTPEDVRELGQMVGDARRISRQGWIEQAALLALGIDTDFAARVRRGERAALVAMPTTERAPAPATEMPETASEAAGPADLAIEPPALVCEVIDLSERRKSRRGRRSGIIRSAGRWGALAGSILFLLGIVLDGTGLLSSAIEQVGYEAACSDTATPSDAECARVAEAAH